MKPKEKKRRKVSTYSSLAHIGRHFLFIKTAIKDETHFNRIEPWTMDQGDFSTIRAFADKAEKELNRIDIFVQNAGIADPKYSTTVDGWEQQ
jgi:NAD(P)-dependent dehydrogenase (short-subunit alcohol dehydrogenase family)